MRESSGTTFPPPPRGGRRAPFGPQPPSLSHPGAILRELDQTSLPPTALRCESGLIRRDPSPCAPAPRWESHLVSDGRWAEDPSAVSSRLRSCVPIQFRWLVP